MTRTEHCLCCSLLQCFNFLLFLICLIQWSKNADECTLVGITLTLCPLHTVQEYRLSFFETILTLRSALRHTGHGLFRVFTFAHVFLSPHPRWQLCRSQSWSYHSSSCQHCLLQSASVAPLSPPSPPPHGAYASACDPI